MKKLSAIFWAFVIAFTLTACSTSVNREESGQETVESDIVSESSDSSQAQTESFSTQEQNEEKTDSSTLVAYFSWADNAVLTEDADAIASASVVQPGNVAQLAYWVQEETNGDLFSIRVTDPYPSDWDECLARANQERGDNARPELVENVAAFDQYDTVFLGYPNWWYGVPMALLTFLEQNDLSGKEVYLFCSHGTGGLSRSVEIITEAVPDAVISENIFHCYEEDAASSQTEIQAWIQELGFGGALEPVTDIEPRQIAVQFSGGTVVYELNNSAAANSLYAQLPLMVEIEDYSDNEKIFYPTEALDTTDTPTAQGRAGTLAYYAPWGDVVLFYGDFNENPSLFQLGQVVSGEELVSGISGTVTIETMEP